MTPRLLGHPKRGPHTIEGRIETAGFTSTSAKSPVIHPVRPRFSDCLGWAQQILGSVDTRAWTESG